MALSAAELQVVIKAKDEASAALKKVSAEVSGLDKSGAAASKGLGSLSSGFKAVVGAAAGIAIAVGGVTALSGAVASAVGSAINFEQAMSGIKAVSGASGEQMQQLSKLALDLGRDTSFSAGEAAAGISELVKGGVSVADVFSGAASSALDLAAAGGVSVGEAATIAANAMNQFNLKGSDMAHVADLVSGAANASSISVSDFNQSLAAGGSVAALAGQSIDSFSTAVALMGAQGIKGSDAGTSLKAAINNLIPTTDTAKKAMMDLGIITADGSNQFIDASGKMKSFGEIAEVLQTQTEGLTDSQRLLALELIFGSDGMRAAGVLAKQGGEGFDAMAEAMGAAGGAAEIARERLNNAAGDIEQLKGSLETAAITIASLFLPAVRSIAQTMTGAVNAFTQEASTLIATAQNIAGAHGIGLIPAALTAVELRIGEVFGSAAQTLFHETRAAVEALAETFTTVAAAADTLADATGQRLAPAMETLNQAASGAAPVMDGLRSVLEASVPVVDQLSAQFADFLVQQGLVTAETARLSGAQQQQQAITEALWAILRNNPIAQVFEALISLTAQIQSAQAATGELASATDTAWKAMIAATGAVTQQVAAKLGELAAFIRGLGPTLQADAVSVGVSIVNGIVAGLNPSRVIAASVALAQSAIAAARNALDSHSPSGEFEAIGEDVVAGLVDGIESVAGDAVEAVEDMISEMQAATAGFNLVDSILGGLDTKGQDALANFLHDSERVIEDVGRKAEEIGRKTADALVAAREDAAQAIQDVREGAASRALELVDTQDLNRQIRSVRDAFGEQQDAAAETFDRQQADAEDAYKYERDLARAKTDDEKAEVRERFKDAQADLQRRREAEDASRAFKKQQQADLQAFNDRLEDEALQRQVARLQKERDERIAQITEALDEKTRKVIDQETRERATLAQSASDKLADLKERFFDKVGPLTEETRGKFEELFKSIAQQVGAAASAVNTLADALSRAANVKVSGVSAAGAGAVTWASQPQAVKDMFVAAWGANAQARWEQEHAQEIAAQPQQSSGGGGGGSSAPAQTSNVNAPGFDWGAYNAANQGKPRNPDGTVKSAYGNPLSAGQISRVGETGWGEYFVPSTAGRLVTQNQVAMAAGGGQHGGGDGAGGYWEHTHAIYLDGRLVGEALEPAITGAQSRSVRLGLG